jgi:hypothetical protein
MGASSSVIPSMPHPRVRAGTVGLRLAGAVVLLFAVHVPPALAQAGTGASGGAMDDHFRRQAAEGTGQPSRAFAFAAEADGPVVIERVDERRGSRGAHTYAVALRNRSSATITSCTVVALVVTGGGVVAVQSLPPLTAFKAGQTRRQETLLQGVALGVDDRVAFVIARVERAPAEVWSADEVDLRSMAVEAARALAGPPPR